MNTLKLCKPLLALILVLSLSFPGWGQALVSLPKPTGFNVFSAEQDVELGRQNAAQIRKQLPLLPDSNPVTQYVQQIGRKLVATMPQPTWPYEFHVVQQKDINAFALPGGPIFVNLGTIQAADNEAQLAGVMAHEMSHIYERHSTKQASKQAALQLPLGVLGGLLGGSAVGQLAAAGIGFGLGSVFLKYSRDAEAQADAVGARIMYNAGYNPVEMANFFRKLEEEGGARGSQFFSDHPNPGNRVQAVEKEIAEFPRKNFVTTSAEFSRIHQLALNTRAYSAQEIQQRAHYASAGSTADSSGGTISANSIRPSANFTSFQHQAYTLNYPENWHVFGDSTSDVTIAPEAGVSQNVVAFGVIISGFQPESSNSIDGATRELIDSLRHSSPDLRPVGTEQEIRVNGITGRSVDLMGRSPLRDSSGQPVQEHDWLVILPRGDGTVLYAVFISPDKDFTVLRPTYERMLKSLQMR
ncbi:MAG TPA: M48 family metallopeptidase [Terriglobales bacterium]|nr:M48 family metallopeptidase [Terriglobales bacterium]